MAKKKRKSTQDDMVRAYEAAKAGTLSIREAAKKYNIPKSTLIDKVKGKSPLECKKGPKPILYAEEENALAEWGIKMAGIGYTCTRTQIVYTVKTILDKEQKEGKGREKRFGSNNLPGKDWWSRFCDRHEKLKQASRQAIEKARHLTKSDTALKKWKSSFRKYVHRQGVSDPSCIYTCSASRFVVNEHRALVKYSCGKKIQERTKYLTVLTAASASGQFIPPMFVYPGDHPDVDLLEDDAIEGALFACSNNGDMSVELFYSWLGNHFLEYTPAGKRVILLIEGTWSYVDMYVSKLCKDKRIVLHCLPPVSSRFQDPLTFGFSRQLANEWKMETMNFELLNPGMKVDKYSFPSVFTNVWNHLASASNIMLAFERSGIWPTDAVQHPQSTAKPDHIEVSCFDEDGNKIEVAMYEEVASDHLSQETTKIKHENNINDQHIPPIRVKTGTVDGADNILGHFEKAQDLSDAQRGLFEARFLADYEGQHDLVYNAWKALKELVVMKQDTSTEFDVKSEKDDDDSLLAWLTDDEDDSERENADDNGNRDENDNGDDVAVKVDIEETDDDDGSGDENDDDVDSEASSLGSSSKNEPTSDDSSCEEDPQLLSKMSPVGRSRGSSARTRMSPLKISRYVHPVEAVRKRRESTSNQKEAKATKKRKGLSLKTTGRGRKRKR